MSISALTIRKKGRCIWRCLTAACIVVLPVALFGQGYFGTVSGIVTDPSAAVVQGATVTIVDEQKGYQFTAKTDSNGRYLFVSIPPGLYSVWAEMKGFQKAVSTHVKLNVSENATANLTLKIAGESQSVRVEAQGGTIETEDAVTGQVVDRKLINDLPLVDRYVLDFAYLTPGVTDMSDANHISDTGTNFVSNGSRGASADILMDGVSITNFEPNGGITNATYVPSAEAVEEFKVQQSNFSAEYGFSGASIINMIERSGTNSFHGEVYDFIRNTITDANSWFNERSGIPIPPVHRHDFGGTFGGPIVKNKTFFFFDWDGTLQSSMSTYQAGVPTNAERTGNFGELCSYYGGTFNASGVCSVMEGQIFDPYSGVYNANLGGPVRNTPIPFNNIATYISPGSPNLIGTPYQLPAKPGNLIDPVAQRILNLFPQPMANVANESPYYNWIASGATPSDNQQYDIKIDHRFSPKNLLSARYSQEWSNTTPYNCFNTFVDPCSTGPEKSNAHLFTINDTHTFSSTLLLTSTLGFTRGTEHIFAYDSSLNANPLAALGFPPYLEANGFNGVPAIFIGGGYYSAGFTSAGSNPYGNYKQGQDTGQLSVMLTNVRGRQELKFGFEGRLHQQNYIQTNAPLGYFQFADTGSSQCPLGLAGECGGDGMASFLMGQLEGGGNSYYEIQFQPATENYQYAMFVQDNLKATHKLTLNLGLRYDISLPRTERFNRMNWFNPDVVNPLNGGSLTYDDQFSGRTTLSLRGGEVFNTSRVRNNWLTDWHDIQPRFGLAYQIEPKTVIRGGYGIYYGQSRSGANGLLSYGSQGFNQYTSVVSTYQNDGATPYLHLDNPFPDGLIQPPGRSLGLLNDVGYGAIGPLRTSFAARTPYEQSWTFGFERQMPWNVVFGAHYIGKKGTHLYFSGANNYDIIPLDKANPTEIGNLETYVSNPFAAVNGGPISDPNSVLSGPQIQEFQLKLPYPQFPGGVTIDVPPIANSTYHALQLTANKRYSNGLELLVSYTWSKSIDDSSMYDTNVAWIGNYGPYMGWALQDPTNPSSERSLSTFDVPSMLKFSYTYDLPIGRGKAFLGNMPRVLEALVGGWKTNGIWQISSGRPLSFFTFNGGTSLPTYGPQRPNFVAEPRRNYGAGWVNNFFANPSFLQVPAPFTLGNAPRTTGAVRTPLAFTSDLSIAKQFLLSNAHEGIRLEMRLEAENAFNHPVFGTPDTNAGDPDFGSITYLAINPRQCQLALKLLF
ncbi:MAG TPA: TonB-dependent receptor [Terriglobales bacterium]|nr:TonB-dependent receptor [Terriglobales bacterium]